MEIPESLRKRRNFFKSRQNSEEDTFPSVLTAASASQWKQLTNKKDNLIKIIITQSIWNPRERQIFLRVDSSKELQSRICFLVWFTMEAMETEDSVKLNDTSH